MSDQQFPGAGASPALKQTSIEVRLRPDQITDDLHLVARYDAHSEQLQGITPMRQAPQESGQFNYDMIADGQTTRAFVQENCQGYIEGETLVLNFDQKGNLLNWTTDKAGTSQV